MTLRDDRKMLVSDTVARAYVAEVDDVREEETDDGAGLDEPTKAKAPVKRAAGKAK